MVGFWTTKFAETLKSVELGTPYSLLIESLLQMQSFEKSPRHSLNPPSVAKFPAISNETKKNEKFNWSSILNGKKAVHRKKVTLVHLIFNEEKNKRKINLEMKNLLFYCKFVFFLKKLNFSIKREPTLNFMILLLLVLINIKFFGKLRLQMYKNKKYL